jgi:hypothetical protein
MKELVHNREYSIRTYDQGDHCILIEGRLKDHRYRPRQDESAEVPKLVHDMVVRLKVRGPEMLIEEADAEMPHHPRKECSVVIPWIRNLEGLRIAAGFTMKVKEIIGDTKGCAHLTSLVITMGPSAVQGYWAAYGVESEKIRLSEEAIKKVINTCYLWREDGPLIRSLRRPQKPGNQRHNYQ